MYIISIIDSLLSTEMWPPSDKMGRVQGVMAVDWFPSDDSTLRCAPLNYKLKSQLSVPYKWEKEGAI